jgi:transposase InsO family protein
VFLDEPFLIDRRGGHGRENERVVGRVKWRGNGAKHRHDRRHEREGALAPHQFVSLEDARRKIEAWRVDYNQQRPHSALGHLTPSEFATHRQDTRPAANGASL